MAELVQISINFSTLGTPHSDYTRKHKTCGLISSIPISSNAISRTKISVFNGNRSSIGVSCKRLFFLELERCKHGVLVREEGRQGRKRGVLVRFNQGFGFNGIGGGGGGGGGGGRDNTNTRVLVNLGLAIVLTYLTMTGQLGWVLDAIVSVWLLAVLLPIVGLGAFFWWAGRDILVSNCPNCGNEFQVFKSTLNDEVQLCPFCSQPFSVVNDEFVKEPVKFSNQATTFKKAFNDFTRAKKGKNSSIAVVDVEAEVKDAE